MFKKLYDWMGSRVNSPYANIILALLFFLEAIFFLPTDPMLIVFCIERRSKAFLFATVATVASVLGGITSYWLGSMLWDYAGPEIVHSQWIRIVMTPKNFEYLTGLYKKYEWMAILTAGFTPVPYKAATLTAGFCKLAFLPFVLCSIISRGARFYLYAIVISIFGVQIKKSIDRYFNLMLILTMIIVGIVFYFFKM